ncbi:MAG: glycoside hydrolase family 2 protein [Oscillospiraceae bacterium]|nr:glycoside hydrolase family 2 protein [Oscillospiraceae bacterium]
MNRKISLSGAWEMRAADACAWTRATVPGSVYADLLDAGKMEDPFWRNNELQAFDLMEKDYLYKRTFALSSDDLDCDALLLTCEGLDTVAKVYVNGALVIDADNMHRTWAHDVLEIVTEGENRIEVHFESPNRVIKERYAACKAEGSSDCTIGFPLLRKAHCMFGWDWGPRLPDAGIWRDIFLERIQTAKLASVYVRQDHSDGHVTLNFDAEIDSYTGLCDCKEPQYAVRYTVTAPNGEVFSCVDEEIFIENPQLWWPNGYGEQPLYTVLAELMDGDGEVLDTWQRRIGLRTMTIARRKDAWGESFETQVNGVSIFAMGADYIPEDNILRRITPERTRRLLEDAKLANFNAVRVWGGGYYPGDDFYDVCDELGLVVWQDLMFACAVYELTDAFEESIVAEIQDNVRRLRHHPSLGLWCGNNEMEQFVDQGTWVSSHKQKADYIRMYEYIFPKQMRALDPQAFDWPASPSSGGGFDEPNDPNRGDVHYWDVWHSNKPFTEYRKFFFRYASEFGFQSFPSLKTIESFTLPEDRNIFSYVMEKHQRNDAANGKIMNYLAQTFRYPGDFDTMLYASQLLQAEAIRYGVEHWRRHRGRCMGAVYWQFNDCWPVASWSSVDYYGRWKALHYAAKRFFAPVLLSCCEEGTLTQRTNVNSELREDQVEKSIRLNVSNETMGEVRAVVKWALRDARATVKREGGMSVQVDALSAQWLNKIVFEDAALFNDYVSYELWVGAEKTAAGTALFCAPKHFGFVDPELKVECADGALRVSAKAYARMVEIICEDGDVVFEDNYFDLNAEERTIKLLRGEGTKFSVRSVYDIGS